MLGSFFPLAFVCTPSADFVKYLTYCLPALFVIMYITMSDVIFSFTFGCEVNVGIGLKNQELFFINCIRGTTMEIFLFVYTVRRFQIFL